MTSSQSNAASLRAQVVVGTRRRQWQIVNEHGGLVKYFKGTQRQADAEARRLTRERSK